MDPREPDPVYVTLREAARKRSDTGRQVKKHFHRRRCYSENGVNTNSNNKLKNHLLVNGNPYSFTLGQNHTFCPLIHLPLKPE